MAAPVWSSLERADKAGAAKALARRHPTPEAVMRVRLQLGKGDALIIVDVQNDFLPGGSLAVAGGAAIVPVLNRYAHKFLDRHLPVSPRATGIRHPDDGRKAVSEMLGLGAVAVTFDALGNSRRDGSA